MLESETARRRRLRVALAAQPDTVVFVCHGNIMRSAFAQVWTRTRHPEMAAQIMGAGTHASRGREAQSSAMLVGGELGCSLATHRASPLSDVDPGDNALLICMDRANEAAVMAYWPDRADRVFLIGDVALVDAAALPTGDGPEVRDPYGRGDDATRAAFATIVQLVDGWSRAGGMRGVS